VGVVSKSKKDDGSTYHVRGTPAQFVGIVYDAPDEQAAIKRSSKPSRSSRSLQISATG
jgi:hypothetical protein